MHEIEPMGFCTILEYQQYIEKRKQAAELTIRGLYLVMAAFKNGGSEGKRAFKFPINTVAVDLGEPGNPTARLTINLLDEDLQPIKEVSITMQDGLSTNPGLSETSSGHAVGELYVKDYEDFMTGGPGHTHASEEVRQLELVGV